MALVVSTLQSVSVSPLLEMPGWVGQVDCSGVGISWSPCQGTAGLGDREWCWGCRSAQKCRAACWICENRTDKWNSWLTTKHIARVRWDFFFPDVGLKMCFFSAENAADFTGTSRVRAEGIREVWDAVTDGVCPCSPVCSPLALLMLKGGGGGGRGRGSFGCQRV